MLNAVFMVLGIAKEIVETGVNLVVTIGQAAFGIKDEVSDYTTKKDK